VERVKQLVNDVGLLGWFEIALIIATVLVAISASRVVLEFLARVGPSRARLYLLGAVPILRLVLLIGGVLWIVPIVFDVTLKNFVFIAGGISVALGFAFKALASSLIAGIVALFERPYRAGDWVRIGDDYGEVRSIGLRSLQLVTPDDDVITVPHHRLWDDNVSTSNDGESTLMCVASFFVAGAHDADALRHALRDVALSSAWLRYDRPVLVIVDEHPWGTRYRLKAYPFDMRDQFLFITDLSVRGREAMAELGARAALVQGLPQDGAGSA